MDYIIVIILIIFSALFSGLTLGLMSLSAHELKRKMSLGDRDALKVYKIRKDGNLLLSTLLIGNVAVNSTLSIFLGSITSGFAAAIIATTLIVIFGEIAPQAVFSRFALKLGAKTAWLVQIFIYILYPICRPIASVLDKTLGNELPTVYSKKELMKIIEEHEDSDTSDVGEEEEKIVKGALSFSNKKVRDIMTPRTTVVAIDSKEKINRKLLDFIENESYSRLPVYKESPDNIIGILYISDLLGDKNLNKTVEQVANKEVFIVDEQKTLESIFSAFLRTHNHLFVVNNEFGMFTGVVTLEDVLEEIIGMEIMDEGDKYPDLRKVARKKAKSMGKEV